MSEERYRHKKQFGQHFLHDPNYLGRIVAAIRPEPDDLMVEVGPGQGALTRPLLERLKHLHVVEIDRDLIAWLRRHFPAERLTVHEADALKFDFGSLLSSPLPPGEATPHLPSLPHGGGATPHLPSPPRGGGAGGEGANKLRIVGNLPYNISSPLLFHFANYAEQVADMHFMLQKEVVDRMAAAPDTPDYGRLSVMLQARFRVMKLFNVPPGAFNPPPKVDSAVVRLVPLPVEAIPYRDGKRFADIVAHAFGQRRKTLRNTLKGLVEPEVFEALGIDPQRRGETLSVAEFSRLANHGG